MAWCSFKHRDNFTFYLYITPFINALGLVGRHTQLGDEILVNKWQNSGIGGDCL